MTLQPASGRYVLKFISGKYQGGEFALERNQELIIGRSSELEMVLIEDMVSRHHAKITTTENEVFIEDLDSTNGTFVNGEKISSCKLKEGDRILIGTSIVKLVYEELDSSQPPPPPMSSLLASPMDGNVIDDVRPSSMPGRRTLSGGHTNHGGTQSGVLSGLIDQVPLPDLLQLFGSSKKSGCLFITTATGTEGRVYMREGRVYGAVINNNFDVKSHKSFYRMMAWTSGNFLLDTTATAEFEEPIDESVESLMMEGMRILDEVGTIGDDVPPFDSNFTIPHPLEPPLRELDHDQLDVFQAVINHPTMEGILNNCPHSDLEIYRAIVHLLRKEYVQIVQ
ncbi:MAG: FHA domain-containing protein [Bradymonadia bacterium]|jgi:hypothetical protein